MKNQNKGFTLIELLVVISIISLLSSIVIASLSSAKQKAQETALIAQAQEMMKIVEGAITTGDYSVMANNGWNASYFGDANCDNPPTFFNTTDRTSMINACHALFKLGGIQSLGGPANQPFLIGVQSLVGGQHIYTKAYGITMRTLSGKMICVGSAGVYIGPDFASHPVYGYTYNYFVPNASCYYSGI